MFENIIGHQQTIHEMRTAVEADSLPPSLLFSGPAFAGKLSTALELARALTCEKGDALWNCGCRSCRQQRLLLHPNTLLLGGRYFLSEILACGESLRENRREPSQFLYVRAVRKLLRRFDDALWEGEEQKLSRIAGVVESLAETVTEVEPGRELPPATRLEKLLVQVLAAAEKAIAFLGSDNIPVSVIRRARFWARVTSPGNRKVFILENAEGMQDSSRNALLKILEEPPGCAYFILLTTNRAAIIPTILSRTRHYSFAERDEEETLAVIEKIFRLPSGNSRAMKDFFLRMQFGGDAGLRIHAQAFLHAVFSGTNAAAGAARELKSLAAPDAFRYFLEELAEQCSAHLRGTFPDQEERVLDVMEIWNRMLQEHRRRIEVYNMNPEHVLETLYYEMRHGLKQVSQGER